MNKILKLFICLFVSFVISVSLFANVQEDIDFLDGKDFVAISIDNKIFAPNNDDFFDTLTFSFSLLQEKIRIKNWKLDILNAQTNNVIYSFFGEKEIPKTLVWNGQDNKGNVLDGNYKYIFTATINGQNIKIEQKDEIVIDITTPFISLNSSIDTALADKEKNKFVNEVKFTFNIGDENKIDKTNTTLQIFSFKNKIIKEWIFDRFNEIPQSISWDGKDDNYDLVVPAGEYKIILTVYDIVHNKTSLSTNITVFEQVVGKDISEIVVKEEPRGLVVNLSSNILFASGKSELKSEAINSLNETIDLLNAYPANKVLIEGYTDSTGKKTTNLQLSYDRAQAVYAYFVQKGILAERLNVVGYGDENPIATNKTEKGRAQNRRVAIIILKTQDSYYNKNDEQTKLKETEVVKNKEENNI